MRPDRLYLEDIVEAGTAIGRFLAEVEESTFLSNDLLQSAVLQKLTIIGEAAARVSKSLRAQTPHVEWGVIIGLRNIVVHAYFSVSWPTVWETAQRDVPELLSDIQRILERLPKALD